MANYHYESDNSLDSASPDRETLTQQVYIILREEIMSGKLKPGYRLVRRKESERLNVSRMAVTEALFKLEIDGFVESRPMYGSRVRPLAIDDVKNDQVLREALECHSARLLTQNATDRQLNDLLEKASILDRIIGDSEINSKKGMQAHFDFHKDIAMGGGYKKFAAELEKVWFRRLMRLNWLKATKIRHVPKDWHQDIIKACISRNIDKAQETMRKHVRYGCEDDMKALDMAFDFSD
jgi:DNA-binding GntR family transcriptional regulator